MKLQISQKLPTQRNMLQKRNSTYTMPPLKLVIQTHFIMEVVKQHLNSDIIIITNPLNTIEKLTPLNYQKPFGN